MSSAKNKVLITIRIKCRWAERPVLNIKRQKNLMTSRDAQPMGKKYEQILRQKKRRATSIENKELIIQCRNYQHRISSAEYELSKNSS